VSTWVICSDLCAMYFSCLLIICALSIRCDIQCISSDIKHFWIFVWHHVQEAFVKFVDFNQKRYTSYFVTFQRSFLHLKCPRSSVSTKLRFHCRRIFDLWSSSQQFTMQAIFWSSANVCLFMNSNYSLIIKQQYSARWF